MRDLGKIKRIVIKVGTSTLTQPDGRLNRQKIKLIIKELAYLSELGYELMLVSSGAVGAGIGKLEMQGEAITLVQKRALAAVGQVELMRFYESLLYAHDLACAQLLLTRIDFTNQERFKNLSDLCNILLAKGIIPIVNENDAVVVNEIKLGDNDTLSALSCKAIQADLLLILSDVDGLYLKDPQVYLDQECLSEVNTLDSLIYEAAGGAGTSLGTGGMRTKIEAAEIALADGVQMIILNGKDPRNIRRAVEGEEIGTIFRRKTFS